MSFEAHLWAVTAACMVVSYLICGIPFGEIFGRVIGHVDLQKVGSGNIGTTNALRAGGPKVAALTLLCDVLKGVVCVLVAREVIAYEGWGFNDAVVQPGAAGDLHLALVALACLLGHVFSPYLRFRGGKGIAVGLGVLLAWYWPQGLAHLAVFIVLVAATRYVSVGSIVTALCVPLTTALLTPQASLPCKLVLSLMALVVVWAHRGNIGKLMRGTESKLSFTKRADKLDGDGGR